MEDRGRCRSWTIINGPKDRYDDCFICNEGKLCDTWDHHPIYERIQEGRDAEQFLGNRKKKWRGWAPKTVEHKIEFMKKVMENDGCEIDENLTTIQKTIGFAAGNVAHRTNAESDNIVIQNTRRCEKA